MKASTSELEEFSANQIPAYAILSHTWEQQEVLFGDIQRHTAESKTTAWRKVQATCQQAMKDGIEYVWIDSCCIDKSSSAELSETINSMYAYYDKAAICYAYLADVPVDVDPNKRGSAFEHSRWFRRGWTLQELLAPSEMVFFTRNWVDFGTKRTLCNALSRITRVDEEILMRQRSLSSVSVARRMAWAAHRETTRPEDIAYCLMGIFSVNMPMLYGEGEKAFIRLQEEIMRQSDDHSIFAWVDRDVKPSILHGLLADSPSKFAGCDDIIPYQDWEPRQPYALTNRGLQISLPLARFDDDVYVAALDCPSPPDYKESSFVGIFLKRLSEVDEQYARAKLGVRATIYQRGTPQTIYIRQRIMKPEVEGAFPTHVMQIRSMPSSGRYKVKVAFTKSKAIETMRSARASPQWNCAFRLQKGMNDVAAFVAFAIHDGQEVRDGILVALGSAKEFDVGFDVFDTKHPEEFRSSLDFKSLDALFEPKRPGTWVALEHHLVKINAEPRINPSSKLDTHSPPTAAKYFLVDIEIECIPKSSNLIQAATDAIQIAINSRKKRIITPQKVINESEVEKPEPGKRERMKHIFGGRTG